MKTLIELRDDVNVVNRAKAFVTSLDLDPLAQHDYSFVVMKCLDAYIQGVYENQTQIDFSEQSKSIMQD